ncbi:hypothetical protein SAMN05216503_3219 [Polaribacter sp. KT25b]|uniref:hypothetical protein n=1 Tax=Polaribacter sp. KT25b TaxID=1855336 RepID=UPI00087DDDD2|nr:hypothetical protein [Polaribacter sp. KT25b]SDS48762.1 hypothetical protein SAMN05216503_3219 [Polaribacter sp. KT25b]
MKKYIYFVLLLLCCMCSNDLKENKTDIFDDEETTVLDNEAKLKQLYNDTIIPLFSDYNAIDIPIEFQIIKDDMGINAGASFGYVEVSMGLVNLSKKSIQLFALTHEVAHIATLPQARLFHLEGYVTNGAFVNEYQKSEYLADLIAIHLIKTKAPIYFEALKEDLAYLKLILGGETFTHPSGANRLKEINKYITLSNTKTSAIAFKELYVEIWF